MREGFRDRQVIRLREAISTLGENRMRLSIADMKRTIYSADEEHKRANSPVKLMDETINEKALYIEPRKTIDMKFKQPITSEKPSFCKRLFKGYRAVARTN